MYCTITDLINDITYFTICELVNDENADLESINLNNENIFVNRINEQIKNAKAEIDFYLNNKIIIDLNSIPNIINTIARDITVYYLYKRRFLSKVPSGVANNYTLRINQLKEIAAGKMIIIYDSLTAEKYLTNKSKEDRIFNY
jgi:phage gp36-like protein